MMRHVQHDGLHELSHAQQTLLLLDIYLGVVLGYAMVLEWVSLIPYQSRDSHRKQYVARVCCTWHS